MAISISTTLTRHISGTTIVTSNFLNSLYGGLYDTDAGANVIASDPVITGHIHDGQHLDGHAQKINLSTSVTDKLGHVNIGDGAVKARNVEGFLTQSQAIPETILIDGIIYYYLDLSDLKSDLLTLDRLFEEELGYRWGESSPTPFGPDDGSGSAFGIGLLRHSVFFGFEEPGQADLSSYGVEINIDGRACLTKSDTTTKESGWANSSPEVLAYKADKPRLSIKASASVLDDTRIFIGMTQAGALSTLIGSDKPGRMYIGFQYSGENLRGDTNWQVITRADGFTSPNVNIDTGVPATVDAALFFDIKFITETTVQFSIFDHTYVNKLYVGTQTIDIGSSKIQTVTALAKWHGALGDQFTLKFYNAVLMSRINTTVV